VIVSKEVELVWAIILLAVFACSAILLKKGQTGYKIKKITKKRTIKEGWKGWMAWLKNNKKIWIRDLVAFVCILAAAVGLEYTVFQWDSFTHEHYDETFTLAEADACTVNGDDTTYSFQLDEKFVRYIYVYFEGEEDLVTSIHAVVTNGYGSSEEVDVQDSASVQLGKSAISLGQTVQSMDITVATERAGDITQIIIANKYVFWNARFLLVFAGLLYVYLFLVHREFFGKRPALVYSMLALVLGTVLIWSSHYALDSWDEQIHLNNVYVNSWIGHHVDYYDAAMANIELRIPTGDTVEEEQWIGQWLDAHDQEVVLINPKKIYIDYTEIAYIPQIVGQFIGRSLGLHYTAYFFLGKFMNLLFCVAVVACAIHFSKYGKRILMCIGLVPTALFQFSCYTYDGFVLSLLMLGLSLFMTEYLSRGTENWKRIMVSLAAVVVGTFSKAVYIPLLAIYWLLPKDKFTSKKQRILFRGLVAAFILIMLATFVLPILTSTASGTEISGDYRGGDTSQTGQLKLIFSYPATYAGILLRSIGDNLANFFIGPNVLTNFAYRGIYSGIGFFVITLTLMFVYTHDYGVEQEALSLNNRKLTGMKLFQAFLMFGTICLIWTALYLDFTAVGSDHIAGVSPRYYLPLLLPFSFLFINRKLKTTLQLTAYTVMVGLLMYVGAGITIYNLVLKL
jgi:uncharacterized membrane protein